MAEVPPIPKTTKEAMIALWYTIHNGLSKAIRETRDLAADTAGRVQGIEGVMPTLWTREQHEKMHADYVGGLENQKKDRKLTTRDVLMLLFVGAGFAVSTLFSVLMYLADKGRP